LNITTSAAGDVSVARYTNCTDDDGVSTISPYVAAPWLELEKHWEDLEEKLADVTE